MFFTRLCVFVHTEIYRSVADKDDLLGSLCPSRVIDPDKCSFDKCTRKYLFDLLISRFSTQIKKMSLLNCLRLFMTPIRFFGSLLLSEEKIFFRLSECVISSGSNRYSFPFFKYSPS